VAVVGRGKPGRPPETAKREQFARLIERGVSSAQAARTVGIAVRTAYKWRRGYVDRRSNGSVRHYAPVVATVSRREISPRFLSLDERIKIADLGKEGLSIRQIAVRLGRAPSTISREIRRHARPDAAAYRPFDAHRRAVDGRARPRKSRLAGDEVLREHVTARLKARWSPEQIARELRGQFPDAPSRWVCTETIYQAVYRPDLGGLPRELPGRVLRRRRRQRVPRRHAHARRARSLVDMTPIGDRPTHVLERVEPGHWEGDLIAGSANKSAIVTLVERTTRFTVLGHLPAGAHGAEVVHDAVINALRLVPPHMRKTLTWDQGKEMALHAKISKALSLPIYFCDPHSPWQRPSNENTNGLLRDYFPKTSDLSVHTPDDLAAVAAELNTRPRRTLGWQTPAALFATLAAT
jgi:IS30 family transposase